MWRSDLSHSIHGLHRVSLPSLICSCCPQNIVAAEGVQGLFFRGLGTKLITNGIQGILFSVLWRLGQDYLAKKEADEKKAADDKQAAEDAAASKDKKKK